MAAPEDIRAGAVSRDPECHVCGPHPHHMFGCDRCLCSGDIAPGIYTEADKWR